MDLSPAIFWHSDPVGPDETVMLSGHLLGNGSKVELVQMENVVADKTPRQFKAEWEKSASPEIISQTEQSLAFVIPPAFDTGIYACRIVRGAESSETVLINAPDVRWFQGDRGLNATTEASWLRVLGKSLNFGGVSTALLRGTKTFQIVASASSMYSLEFRIPDEIPSGDYELFIHNGMGGTFGWKKAGLLCVSQKQEEKNVVMNVVDMGGDPEGLKDSTFAIVQAMERLSSYGGGTVFFPSGRYRIDSVLRTGTFIASPLVIPRGISFKGENRDRVSLWWPDRKEPLYTLIECMGDNTISGLSIFTQGRHRNIISSDSDNITIKNVLIRANCYYMCMHNGSSHHRRGIEEGSEKMGWLLEFNRSRNVQISDCDLYGSNGIFRMKHVEGCRMTNCKTHGTNFGELAGGDSNIIENVDYAANSLVGWGFSTSLHYGAVTNRRLYFAHNKIARVYGGDHEAFTLDGHGTAYIGAVLKADGVNITLSADPVLGMDGCRDNLPSLEKTNMYILSGKGRGQYRALKSYNGKEIEIESPFAVAPDENSIVSIGAFNGGHLIIGNTMEDSGTIVQLYPPNFECIVAENKAVRSSNMNSCSKLGRNTGNRFQRVEPSWYNQFLDNRVIVGNGWGGGESEIDRWLGGEGTLNIWGWQVRYHVDPFGCDQDAQLEEKDIGELLQRKNPEPESRLPISIFQIVRRHIVDNNSSIRVRGAVADILIEHCNMNASKRGVRIDNEVVKPHIEDIGQLAFEPPQEMPESGAPQPFLSPLRVIARKNIFKEVKVHYSGTALQWAKIIN